MTSQFCLDSNVIIKLFIKEGDSHQAGTIYTQKGISFISSSFAKYEIFATLRKKSARKECSIDEIKTAFDSYKNLRVEFLPDSDDNINEAYDLAEKLNLPVIYDCLYLVCAKKNHATFVSADEVFIKCAKKVYPRSFSLKEVVKKI